MAGKAAAAGYGQLINRQVFLKEMMVETPPWIVIRKPLRIMPMSWGPPGAVWAAGHA